jgi:hypothetical protein
MGSTSIWEYVENGSATLVVVAAAADPADTATEATTPAAVTALAVAAASTRLKRICLLLQKKWLRTSAMSSSTALDSMFKLQLSTVVNAATSGGGIRLPGPVP